VVTAHPDSPAGRAFRQMAENAAARISVVMLQSADIIPITVIG
jgi:hypothetical protein